MNKKIISITGKAQSGKSSSAAFLACQLFCYEMNEKYKLDNVFQTYQEDNKIFIMDGNENYLDSDNENIFNLLNSAYREEFNTDIVFCKSISCATPIKDFIVNILGVDRKSVDGTGEDKLKPINYSWSGAPESMRKKFNVKETDFHTGRSLMTYLGTELLRFQFDNAVWIKSLINSINKMEHVKYVFVPDVRFKIEVDSLLNANSLVIRLDKNKFPEEKHMSEIDLDLYNFNNNSNIKIINNQGLTLQEKNKELNKILQWIK